MKTHRNHSIMLASISMALIVLSPLAIDIYLPAFNDIASSLKVEQSNLQASITFFMISLGIGQLIVGPLSDKYGRKPIAFFGICVYMVSSIVVYYAQSIDVLLTARFMQGFGASATTVVAFALVKDNFNASQSSHMISYLNGAMASVPALAPTLGHWLTVNFGWRSNFAFLALCSLVVGILVWRFVRELPQVKQKHQPVTSDFQSFITILKMPIFLFHASLCALTTSAVLAYITSAPIWLVSNIGLEASEFTFWFTVNAVINIVAYIVTPLAINKLGRRNVLRLGLALTITSGILLQALAYNLTAWGFMLPIFIASIGFACIIAPSAAQALSLYPTKAGTVAALLGFIQLSGSGLVTWVTQTLNINIPDLVTLHMWLLIPACVVLFGRHRNYVFQAE
ncbi:Bcr/CflA family efflux MFS transporter [Vibrio fluminensis]|uniref:Bcr/CflA family efflux MFS transporter n=1 Tax=Vibrio fluminensis TaxID=2783614 RepID=UPI00188802FD